MNAELGFASTTNEVIAGIDLTGKTVVVTGGSAHALDKDSAQLLWELSEKLVGQRFEWSV